MRARDAGNEWKYVKECLDTGWVSSVGTFVDRFEQAIARYVGCRHAVAAVNGTAALHVALRVAGVEADDEVLVSDMTFIAPVNAVRYLGALAGVDRCRSRLLADGSATGVRLPPPPMRLEERPVAQPGDGATGAGRVARPRPGPSLRHGRHLGSCAEVRASGGRGCHRVFGALYKGRMTGEFGDIACFSFNGNKLITTGGGGMIVTDQADWAAKAKYLTTQAKDDPLEYVHYEIGYNYRLTNVLAAIGVAQMERLDEHLAAKRRIAAFYARELQAVPGIETMPEAEWAKSTVLDVHGAGGRGRLRHGQPRRCSRGWRRRGFKPGRCGSRSIAVRPMPTCRRNPARWRSGCTATP